MNVTQNNQAWEQRINVILSKEENETRTPLRRRSFYVLKQPLSI